MPELSLPAIIIAVYIFLLLIGVTALAIYSQKLNRDLKTVKDELAAATGHLSIVRQELAYAQHRLQEQNQTNTVEAVLNAVSQAYIIVNPKGIITLFNPQAEKLLQHDKLSAVLKPYREIIRLIDRGGNDISEKIDDALKGKSISLPPWSSLIRESGNVTVAGSITPIPTSDGKIEYVIVMLHDISSEHEAYVQATSEIRALSLELATAEHKLQSEARLSDLSKLSVSEMNLAVIGLDADENITIMNNAAEQFTGLFERDVRGKPFRHELRMINKKDEEDFSVIEEALRGKTVHIGKWLFLSKRGGGKGVISGVAFPLHANGIVSGAAISFQDAQEQYEDEIEQKAFFSGAAHDLRSPLTTIRGAIELLRDNFDTIDREQAKEIVHGANDAITHLITLVNDLLNVSRIDMGRLVISKESFDIVPVTKDIIERMGVLAKEKHLFIEHNLSDLNNARVYADKMKVEEVLINLLSNAIKYTQQGGISVSQTFENGKIITTVTDSGTGITPENQKLLFKKFQQVGSARNQPMAKSSGLGLYIAKKFATLMGGDVQLVKSEIGRGSTFAFTLPTAG